MNNYYNNLNNEIKEYFNILSNEFPDWLLDYINTPEMQRIHKISMSCGTDYSKCFNLKYWYSNLDHSVAVALIIWHFTHDKKQTLAGLFHDIATPVFKHCIDFMNGDLEKQESTEEKTTEIIKNSKEIMQLLKRDNINLEEIDNYKRYPIADNDTPKLSADRFEYNFSSGLTFFRVWDLHKIRKIYDNVVIDKNEDGIDELVFKNKKVCEEYINIISKLWPEWISDKDKTVMQFLADICKSMNNAGFLTVDDLYRFSEKEIIEKIINCEDPYLSESFKKFQQVDQVYSSPIPVENKYCVNINPKKRYIIPLVQTEKGTIRINKISDIAKKHIDNYLNMPTENYTYLDFDFKPYVHNKQKILKKNILTK
ncbi:MAG: HD domain-containing protein [Bacilli bacterium]|nr:HD domain-containing protein [Bacilli bacterium]